MRDVKAPEMRRQEIMDASLQLFMEKGYLMTRTQDIIDRVGISRGLLYYHFKNKEDILYCLIENYSRPLIQRLAEISQDKNLDAKEKIQQFYEALKIKPSDQTKAAETLQDIVDMEQNSYLMDRLGHKIIDRSSDYLSEILEQGNQEGIFSAAYPQALAHILMTALVFVGNESVKLNENKEAYLATFSQLLNCTLNVDFFK